ncbi:GDSL-type esterase/lipase family protein [Propioniferax innocua]|uniref:GDSL-like lipase/acylhydrolase family protein n=1 Tax=Propioniferax innocua TaxID=1753 RepID=A0A542ZRS2_9ACTN|nr:GDSL-type esterase/lipase family protein [Propioniferax innocua]TQL63032.1 GDSL-like lipase/acylhydrolase family protein [Propioniferax innocua]
MKHAKPSKRALIGRRLLLVALLIGIPVSSGLAHSRAEAGLSMGGEAPVQQAEDPGAPLPRRGLVEHCRVTFGAVGSSHTDGGYPVSGKRADDGDDEIGTYLHHDHMVDTSWAYYTTRDPYVHLDGGWAYGGSTVERLADTIEPSMFHEDSYAVILAGTVDNLPGFLFPPEKSMEHYPRIVENTGVAKENILIVNLPPVRHLEQRVIDYNEALEAYADKEGIRVFDLHSLTSNGYNWRPGYDADGAHFTPEIASVIGQAIADTLSDMSGCVGDTHSQVAQLAGLGPSTSDVTYGLVNGGKVQEFTGGAVYSSTHTAAAPIHGRIRSTWETRGGPEGPFGYPLDAERCFESTCTQYFQGGRIVHETVSGLTVPHPYSSDTIN